MRSLLQFLVALAVVCTALGVSRPVAALAGVIGVAAGDHSACALDADGIVRCWGRNDRGQLGNGTTTDSAAPVIVNTAQRFVTISGGAATYCGVTAGGTAHCWGAGSNGMLGNGAPSDSSTPVQVSNVTNFRSISPGGLMTCGVTTADVGYCWGHNYFYQLGDGTQSNSWVPRPVVGGHSFKKIEADYGHVCGLTIDGAVYCWGRTSDIDQGDQAQPALVTGGPAFVDISLGAGNLCGHAANGLVYCLGGNYVGQFGNGDYGSGTSTFVLAAGGGVYSQLSVSYDMMCAVDMSNAAFCAGSQQYGQLGNGAISGRSQSMSAVSGGYRFRQVEASYARTFACGVTLGGGVMCWGDQLHGSLGNGTATATLAPTPQATHQFAVRVIADVGVDVDPWLNFTVAGASSCSGVVLTGSANASSVNLGRVNAGSPVAAAQDLTVSTNAASGAVVYQQGTDLSGPRSLLNVTGTNGTPGAFGTGERYGYTVGDPDVPGFSGPQWASVSLLASPVMRSTTAGASTGCIAYQLAITTSTPAGLYRSTVTYTAVPTF